jgi:hypothetical protein
VIGVRGKTWAKGKPDSFSVDAPHAVRVYTEDGLLIEQDDARSTYN